MNHSMTEELKQSESALEVIRLTNRLQSAIRSMNQLAQNYHGAMRAFVDSPHKTESFTECDQKSCVAHKTLIKLYEV